MYCGKECQKVHWKDHKASCELYATYLKSPVDTGFNATKWFNSMPGMVDYLKQAVANGKRLAVVEIVVGENERRCAVILVGCDNQEELEKKKQQYPGFAHMFRFDSDAMKGGLSRVVVVIEHTHGTSAMRMRV